MRVAGTFNGTGADVWINLGFVPDYVTLWNLQGTQGIKLVWNKHMMRLAATVEGIQYTGLDYTAAALTKGNGIIPYFGGQNLVSGTGTNGVGTTTFGSVDAIYLKPDYFDYRRLPDTSVPVTGDASEEDIDTWTLYSASNYRGHFNGGITGTYIGVGSPINIDGKTYSIVAFVSDGSDTNDVTLNLPVKSGKILSIHGMYDLKPMVAGEVSKRGFLISNTTINVTAAQIAYEAGQYDR